ncbi:hypothetical protein HK104_002916 [Borealophlyctis nickersoniae]|nr:hypothetical protein HK104_002916 [Borealophlyctis nickersoniae]
MHPDLQTSAYPTPKPEFYAIIAQQTEALLDPSLPLTANLANFSSLLYHAYRDNPVSRPVNWVGFYLIDPTRSQKTKTLALGPFQGRVACTLIPFGKGVCGTAAAEQKTLVVPDVLSFKGHIACDSASRSEVVVPIIIEGDVVGVLDLDCEIVNGFDEVDGKALEQLVQIIVQKGGWERR